MSDLFDQPEDATPLEPEEREGLRPSWISTRSELNQAEQANITAGVAWVSRSRRKDLLIAYLPVGRVESPGSSALHRSIGFTPGK